MSSRHWDRWEEKELNFEGPAVSFLGNWSQAWDTRSYLWMVKKATWKKKRRRLLGMQRWSSQWSALRQYHSQHGRSKFNQHSVSTEQDDCGQDLECDGWMPYTLWVGLNILSISCFRENNSKASNLWHSASFMVQLSHLYNNTRKTIALTDSVQSLSRVQLLTTPWTEAHQASLSITNTWSPPKPMSIKSVMSSNHLILCLPLLLLPSIFPSIRVFSNESALRIRWTKYWSFSFNISPSNEHPGFLNKSVVSGLTHVRVLCSSSCVQC